jgi:hypothetical protein
MLMQKSRRWPIRKTLIGFLATLVGALALVPTALADGNPNEGWTRVDQIIDLNFIQVKGATSRSVNWDIPSIPLFVLVGTRSWTRGAASALVVRIRMARRVKISVAIVDHEQEVLHLEFAGQRAAPGQGECGPAFAHACFGLPRLRVRTAGSRCRPSARGAEACRCP